MLVMPLGMWLRRNPRQSAIAWMLVGFFPFVLMYFHLFMAVDSTAEWGGYVKGAEVSILDLIVLALYISVPGERHPLPFGLSMAFYFLTVLLSAFQARFPTEALMYSWQLARMFLVYATVAKGSADVRVTSALMKGMGAALIMEAAFAVWQRFGSGMIQTHGTFEHQNLLGLMSHLVILPFFALLLTGRRGVLPPLVILAGAIIDVLTASRGTIGLVAFGLAAVFTLSAVGRWTSRKIQILWISLAALVVVAPAVVMSFGARFNSFDPVENSYDERAAYKAAAAKMFSDNPLGIGANHFAVIGNMEGYYAAAGVDAYFLGRAGNVHNIYYLTAAEAGYPGLIALMLLFSQPIFVAIRCGYRNLRDDRGNLLIGMGVALLTVSLHSWVEWIWITFSAQYLTAIIIGMVAGNAQQLGYWRPAQRLSAPVRVRGGRFRGQSPKLKPMRMRMRVSGDTSVFR
jgi:O-antigen ligase